MELAELLDREGLTPDALMPWAHARSTALIAELIADVSPEHELLILLGTSESVGVDELPPPFDRRADGEPEPLLETFDTRPILLGTAEAESLLDETSAPTPELDDETTKVERAPGLAARDQTNEVTRIERSPTIEPTDDASETSVEPPEEEIELDELVEIDDAELEMLEEEDDDAGDDEASEDSAPVRSGDTASGLPIVDPDAPDEPVPVQTGHTAAFPTIPLDDPLDERAPVQTGQTAAHSVIPVQSGGTAKHATLDEPITDDSEDVDLDAARPAGEPDEDFELDFD